jgi:hypothetical protein
MTIKLPLLAIFIGILSSLAAQNSPRTIELSPNWKPYEWSMMPAEEFFKLTGLSEADSISYRTYRIGPDSIGSIQVRIDYILETNTDVVGYIKYENWKVKDIYKLKTTVETAYDVVYAGEDDYDFFWLGDALVELSSMYTESSRKRGHFDLMSTPMYQFIPDCGHAIAKLDSTWSQLINNPTSALRGIRNDSGTYRVTFQDISPVIEYEVQYPADESEVPSVLVSTTVDGGAKALKWSMMKYYTQYLDSMDEGEIWIAPTDEPMIPIAYLFNNGVLYHSTISQEEYKDWFEGFAEDEE